MKRRWLIRSMFITLLLLSLAAWAWSHPYGYTAGLKNGPYSLGTGLSDGVWLFAFGKGGDARQGFQFEKLGWSLPADFSLLPSTHSFLRFLIGNESSSGISQFIVGVPLWFLTSMLTLTLIYVWRKTRPKPNPATAFPVEIDKVAP